MTSTEQPVAKRIGNGVRLAQACSILREPDDLFRFWRKLSNLPLLMPNLVSVVETSPTRSHWVAKGPLDLTFEWDAEIINEKPGELIAWTTVAGDSAVHSIVANAGTIRFQPAPVGRGTEARITIEFDPPAGALGHAGAMLTKEAPEKQLSACLHRFKALMESGEVPVTTGQPRG